MKKGFGFHWLNELGVEGMGSAVFGPYFPIFLFFFFLLSIFSLLLFFFSLTSSFFTSLYSLVLYRTLCSILYFSHSVSSFPTHWQWLCSGHVQFSAQDGEWVGWLKIHWLSVRAAREQRSGEVHRNSASNNKRGGGGEVLFGHLIWICFVSPSWSAQVVYLLRKLFTATGHEWLHEEDLSDHFTQNPSLERAVTVWQFLDMIESGKLTKPASKESFALGIQSAYEELVLDVTQKVSGYLLNQTFPNCDVYSWSSPMESERSWPTFPLIWYGVFMLEIWLPLCRACSVSQTAVEHFPGTVLSLQIPPGPAQEMEQVAAGINRQSSLSHGLRIIKDMQIKTCLLFASQLNRNEQFKELIT